MRQSLCQEVPRRYSLFNELLKQYSNVDLLVKEREAILAAQRVKREARWARELKRIDKAEAKELKQ